MTASGSETFHLEGLKLTRRGGSLWVESRNGGPIGIAEVGKIHFCLIDNEDREGCVIASGSREHLEKVDACLKILTVDGPVEFVAAAALSTEDNG